MVDINAQYKSMRKMFQWSSVFFFAVYTKLSIVYMWLMETYSVCFSTFHSVGYLHLYTHTHAHNHTFFPRFTNVVFFIRIYFFQKLHTSELKWQYCSWELKIKLHISVAAAHTYFLQFHLLFTFYYDFFFISFDNLSLSLFFSIFSLSN